MPALKNVLAALLVLSGLCTGEVLNAATTVVRIRESGGINAKYFFEPTNITINAGDAIKWTNTVANPHDSTHKPPTGQTPLWTSGKLSNSPPNNTFSFTFNKSGLYPYFCRTHLLLHPEQTGTVTVVSANLPPSVSLFDPTNGATFFAPASFPLEANATDRDGNVAQVEFFLGGASLGVSTGGNPYTSQVTGFQQGTYAFTAVATDNNGATATSSVVNVTVISPPAITLGSAQRLQDGSFQFRVSGGSAGQTCVIDAADSLSAGQNLTPWTPVVTNTFPNTTCPACPFIDFTDSATNPNRRFYRARVFP